MGTTSRPAGRPAQAKAEEAWLKVAPSHVLQQTLKDLDRACAGKGTFNVRWRAKYRWRPSFRFPAGNLIVVEKLNRRWSRAKLPKLGWVRFRSSRPIGGVIRSATVSRKGEHWFVSFLVQDGLLTPEHHPGTPVGVDRGVKVAATLSSGQFHDRPFASPGEKARHLRLQRKPSRSEKGSANRAKTLQAMGSIATRAVDRRADFCGRLAHRLTTRHDVVDAHSRKSQAEFACTACDHTDHADVNAAKNILHAAGHAVSACGDLGVARSTKQEPAPPRGQAHRPASPLVGIPRL